MTNLELAQKVLPETVKLAIAQHQTHKLDPDSSSLEKIAERFGNMFAERHRKWRPVFEGLNALKRFGG